ncbi:MAG: MoxR family ATPase [Planctomycetia bacterium]|nr:MoxR family ATPase [Planctomycetia bacterium]
MSAFAGEPNAAFDPYLVRFSDIYRRIVSEIGKVFVGQHDLITGTLVALFSSGHVLIESVPGLGKTLFVRALGKILGCRFGRIQFTPDLMPTDITGAPVFDMRTGEFRFRPGPVFTQILLADEINRSPAKTHAALLETMQEYSVSVDNETHLLDRPFCVLATQNPIESEGTYNLPEAQIDRFMFKLLLDYPTEGEEAEILQMHGKSMDPARKLENLLTITSPEEILELSNLINNVYVAPKLVDYINRIVRLTRRFPRLSLGASPRAGLAFMQGARTLAAFHGRSFVIPDEILQLALPILRHRVILSPEAEIEGEKADAILTRLVRSVEIPRL